MGGGPASDTISDRSSDDAVEVTKRLSFHRTEGEQLVTEATGSSERANEGQSTWGQRASSVEEGEDGPERDETGVEMARLLYSKSKVYLHPSSYLRDNIPGFISIVQVQKGSSPEYLLAWIPEASIEGTPDFESYVLVELESPSSNPTLVTLPPSNTHAFSIPIRTLYSLVVQPPTLSSWFGSATLNLFGGDSLPPLYFHDEESRSTVLDRDRRTAALGALGSSPGGPATIPPSWGGEALLSQLRLYAHVVRSRLEPQLFLVNPSRTDIEVHSTALFEDEAVPEEAMARLGVEGQAGRRREREGKRNSILHQSLNGEYPDEVGPAMDNFTFSVLNSFSRITRGARFAAQKTAQSVLSHPLAKPILKDIPEPIAHFATAPGELTRLQETAGVGSYDAARVYLAKWARIVAEEGERARRAEVHFAGPGGRDEDSEVGAFEVLASTYSITRPKSTRAFGTPIVVTEWAAWFDDAGKLMLGEDEAKKRIFQRGLAEDVRKDVWPFLLDIFPWTSSTKERVAITKGKTIEYERLKMIWYKNPAVTSSDVYAEESHRIEIDCRRTDRTHPMFMSPVLDPSEPIDSAHPSSNIHVKKCADILTTYVFAAEDRDYVQGMSDLLSPLYVVAEADEVMAFWCFGTLMERQKGNFLRDQSGMKRQLSELQALLALMDPQLHKHLEATGSLNLFFCFRWILCSFKRELSFDATLALWEILWTDHLGTHFHLFVALAIIEAHRDVIIRYLREFDEVLKYVNELSQTLDIDEILTDAEVLCLTFRRVVDVADRRKAEEEGKQAVSAGGLRRRGKGKGKEGEQEESESERGVVEGSEMDPVVRALLD